MAHLPDRMTKRRHWTAALRHAATVRNAEKGIDGVVDVNAPEVQVDGRLDPLPASYLDVSALLQDHCAARRSVGASSFTISGRPGLPAGPDDYLPSSLVQAPSVGAKGLLEATGRAARLPLRAQLSVFDAGCGTRDLDLATGG